MANIISAKDVAEQVAGNESFKAFFDDLVSDATSNAVKKLEARITDPKGGYLIADGNGNGDSVKSFGDFLVQVARASGGDQTAKTRLKEHYKSVAVKDLSGGTDTAGGYTIPPNFQAELLSVSEDQELLVQPRATEIRLNKGRDIDFPTLDVDTAPTNGSALYGGVVMTLTGEGVAKTATEPAFGTLNIPVYKLAAYTLASDELLDDSGTAITDLLMTLFKGAMSDRWEEYFLNGTGSGQPLGILHSNATGTVTVSRATGGNDFDLADALAMKQRLLVRNRAKVAWGMHPFLETDLVNLALDGNVCVSYVPNLNDAPPLRLLGYPVVFSEHMADPGSAGDVVLGDFSGYIMPVRQDTTIETSIHYKLVNDQTTWRVVSRKGGKPWLMAPVPMLRHAAGTGANAGYTRSHFVKLGT